MAESDGSWWGGWIQTAKEKSAQAMDFVKKDLQEFSTTVQKDTADAATTVKEQMKSGNATVATQKVKQGMTSFLDGISKALVVEAEDKQPAKSSSVAPHIFDRAQARLHAIQVDLSTYCSQPEGPQEKFDKWKDQFGLLEKHKGDISELLVSKVEVRALYTQLVPSTVSHADFWQRYFYKVNQLREAEERRAAIVKRADVAHEEEDMGWDEEDDWDDMGATIAPTPDYISGPTQDCSDRLEPDNYPGESLIPKASSHVEETSFPMQELPSTKSPVNENETSTVVPSSAITSNSNDSISLSSVEDAPLANNSPLISTQTAGTVTADNGVNLQLDSVISPTDTLDSLSPLTDSSSRDLSLSKDSSVETLTIVSPASQLSPDLPEENISELKTFDDVQCVGQSEKSDDLRVDSPDSLDKEIKTRIKGDLVVVGSTGSSNRTTPSSDSKSKGSIDGDDEWDDFDVEVTEEDLKLVQQSHVSLDTQDEDWENWE